MDKIVHVSPSNINSWLELVNAGEDAPAWVNPEKFKESIMGVFDPNYKASAGNAVHSAVFEGTEEFEENGWKYHVSRDFLRFRNMFPFGSGVAEVSKVKYFPDEIDGYKVRISERCDYLCPSLTVEMKTSSRSFNSKGIIHGFLNSAQSRAYTWTWGNPILFLFAEIDIKEVGDSVYNVNLKNADSSRSYPYEGDYEFLRDAMRSMIPYLREDEEMWTRVTTRKTVDEF